ncbi:retrovirus-related pol polyprotein from transposon TNT 1-94 [Tanacetum coccineum]
MVGGNGGNRFRQYARKNVDGYNAVQNVGNSVVQKAIQNLSVKNVRNQNGLIVVLGIANPNMNQIGNGNVVAARAEGNGNGNNKNYMRYYNCRGLGHLARNCTTRPRKKDAAYLQTHLLIAQKEEAGIQLQAEEFDFMAATGDLDEIEEVSVNCILMANLQQASTSGTQIDKAPVYNSDGSAENDSNVISAVSNVEQSRGTVEQNPATVEETRAYLESLYNNLAIKVEKVNTVNRKIKETNANLTTELARYKNQEKCFEINQEKYDKLERCYQNVSKSIAIPNEEFSDDTTPSVARKFLNEFLKKAAKFVRDFKPLAKEADESLAGYKALEFEIERLLKAVVSQDIMSIVQSYPNMFMVPRLGLFQAYDRESKASHQLRLEVLGNRLLWE